MNERIPFDEFSYTIEPLKVRTPGSLETKDVVKLTFRDNSQRGFPPVEVYFLKADWEEFNRQVNGGVLVPNIAALGRVGV